MQEQMVALDGVRLWTITQGEGLPVMLCNGGPSFCDYLGPVAEMIRDRCSNIKFSKDAHEDKLKMVMISLPSPSPFFLFFSAHFL